MPYLCQESRQLLEPELSTLANKLVSSDGPFNGVQDKCGLLNYIFSMLIKSVWENTPRYATGNSIVGALECCKEEFYRRVLGNYENKAIEKNGDMYE